MLLECATGPKWRDMTIARLPAKPNWRLRRILGGLEELPMLEEDSSMTLGGHEMTIARLPTMAKDTLRRVC